MLGRKQFKRPLFVLIHIMQELLYCCGKSLYIIFGVKPLTTFSKARKNFGSQTVFIGWENVEQGQDNVNLYQINFTQNSIYQVLYIWRMQIRRILSHTCCYPLFLSLLQRAGRLDLHIHSHAPRESLVWIPLRFTVGYFIQAYQSLP